MNIKLATLRDNLAQGCHQIHVVEQCLKGLRAKCEGRLNRRSTMGVQASTRNVQALKHVRLAFS